MKQFPFYWFTNFEYYRDKEVSLMKIEDNKYQVSEFGKFKPILNSGCYILVENQIANILQKYVPEQILKLDKVNIYRKATNENWTNYSAIEFNNNLELDEFENANSEGLKIYTFMFTEMYLTPELKNKIELEYKNLKEVEFINELPLVAG